MATGMRSEISMSNGISAETHNFSIIILYGLEIIVVIYSSAYCLFDKVQTMGYRYLILKERKKKETTLSALQSNGYSQTECPSPRYTKAKEKRLHMPLS